ncbi:MAG: DUF294 nucleotidyltransferase-like domain-containing protein [Desulfobacterales bacterium]|nr:DUF294 nucleotidyltransferase-like domain-containing protein [Desulfobacterales bacterium]
MKKRAVIDLESLKRLQETRENLQRVESLPYSEELVSVMDPEVYTCSEDRAVKAVLKEMAGRNVSSVIVVDHAGLPRGILTERDVMQRVVADDDVDPATTPVSAVMTPEPVTLRPGNTIYRALSVLTARRIKHLPLVEGGKVVGIVTLRQLLKLRYPEPMVMIEAIRAAQGPEALKGLRNQLDRMVDDRLHSGRRASDIVLMISMINRDIHRRVLELVLERYGDPPARFCLYVTGSHGRLENLLGPDQDHGMVIADTPDNHQYDQYYVDLSEAFSRDLAIAGFPLCPGYVMAMNPLWRKSLTEWKQQIRYWIERQVRQLGRFATVLFDAAPLAGDFALFEQVRDFAFGELQKHYEVLRVMLEEAGSHRVPLGLLGGFITEKRGRHRGEINIKRSGLLFVVEAMRMLALRHNICETSTLKRLARLVDAGQIHADDAEYFESAYHVLLHLTLSTQIDKLRDGLPLDCFIDPKLISRRDREILKDAFKAIGSLQELVATEFGELVL